MNKPADTPPQLRADDLSWSEVADLVWLAAAIRESRPEPSAPAQHEATGDDESSPPRPAPEPAAPSIDARQEHPESVRANAAAAAPSAIGLQGGVDKAELPAAILARALRPLGRRVPSRSNVELDEEGTAIRAAETSTWLPVLRPASTHLLDVVLVVDASPSMALWRSTAAELQMLLERQGAFRAVRRVDVDTDQEWVRTYTTSRQAGHRGLGQLVATHGQRLVLVLTDGVGAAWRPGAVGRWLPRLGVSGPLAVLNVLPHRLWGLGKIVTEQVRLGATAPALANQRLHWNPVRPDDAPATKAMPVPVLELDPRWLSRWTSLVTATGPVEVELPALLVGEPDDSDEPPPLPWEEPATDLVRAFHLSASPQAFRLAALLAAVPVTRSVMRIVQFAMVPDSSLPHVAEVLLSGLLEPASDDGEYRFRPGVREELLSALRRDDTMRVVRTAAESVAEELPALTALRDAIADPESTALPEEGPSVALQNAVLRALSGRAYVSRADRLRSDSVPLAVYPDAMTTVSSDTFVTTAREAPIWAGVPTRNPDFVERDELAAIHEALAGDSRVVLRGEAGTGKTELVTEYVYRKLSDHTVVWWFAAREPASVVAGYQQLALRLGLTEIGAGGQASVAAVHADLATRAGWLLVFDGAEDPETLKPYLPAGGGVVVTAKDQAWCEHGTVIEVSGFIPEQSVELLRRKVPDLVEAPELAGALGNLPSAVSHAAAWLSGGMPPGEYLERLRTGGPCAPAVDAVSAEARWLLDLCVAFSARPIPRELFIGPAVPAELDDPIQTNRLVRELARAGLLVVDHRTSTLLVPELVREEVLTRQDPQTRAEWRHTAHLLLSSSPVSVDLLGHLWDAAECDDPQVRGHLLALVANLVEHGDPHNAAALADEIRRVWTNMLGADHPQAVAIAVLWGVARRLLGEPEDAVRIHRAHEAGTPQLVHSLIANGEVEAAVELSRTLDESGASGLAESLRLAAVLHGAEVPAECRTLHDAVLARLLTEHGDQHPATLVAMVDAAVTALLRGEHSAEASVALPLLESSVGAAHPYTIACATATAGELSADGENEHAVTLGRKTVRTAAAAWGEEHPLTLAARLNLALDLKAAGQPVAASEMREAAVATCLRALGPTHPLTRLAGKEVRAWHRPDPAPGWTEGYLQSGLG